MGGEGGELLLQMLLMARGAFQLRRLAGTAHQLLKLGSTILAAILENRHISPLYERSFLFLFPAQQA